MPADNAANEQRIEELEKRLAALEEKFNNHGHTTISRSGGFTSSVPKQVRRRSGYDSRP